MSFHCVIKVLFIAVFIILISLGTGWSKNIYVSTTGNCSNDGLTSGTPKKTITCALPIAYPGDVIYISAGTYDSSLGESFPLILKPYKHNDGISLVGANSSTTILDAGYATTTIIDVGNSTVPMTIKNLTLRNVYSVGGVGRGLNISGCKNITVENCIIYNNVTDIGGAGMLCWGSDILITNNIFDNNQVMVSTNDGGGLEIVNGSPTITNNTFKYNKAGAGGGGLHCLSIGGITTSPVIENNTFLYNESEVGGGVSFFNVHNPVFRNNIVRDNTANTGGGIFVFGSGTSPLIDSNIITGNYASDPANSGGAVRLSPGSNATLKNNLIFNNLAAGHAGALFSENAHVTIENCTFYKNDGKLSTLDGIWFLNGSGSIKYSILWEVLGEDFRLQGSASVTMQYTDFHDTPPAGIGNFSQDPLFVVGPYTPSPLGNFYLAKDMGEGGPSPCIDYGDVTADSLGLSYMKTTRSDGIYDIGNIDLGYHYVSHLPTPTPSPTATPVPFTGKQSRTIYFVLLGLVIVFVLIKYSL